MPISPGAGCSFLANLPGNIAPYIGGSLFNSNFSGRKPCQFLWAQTVPISPGVPFFSKQYIRGARKNPGRFWPIIQKSGQAIEANGVQNNHSLLCKYATYERTEHLIVHSLPPTAGCSHLRSRSSELTARSWQTNRLTDCTLRKYQQVDSHGGRTPAQCTRRCRPETHCRIPPSPPPG